MEYFDNEPDRQPRVLFVDSGLARPCASLLKSNDRFAMLVASDGREALHILRHHVVDVIILDEEMPDMAAPYLLAATQELSPATAAIVLTTSGAEIPEQRDYAIRTLLASSSEQTLRAEIDTLLEDIARRLSEQDDIDATEVLADALLSEEVSETARQHVAELYPDFARTMTEQELAATDVLDSEGTAAVIGLPRKQEATASPASGVIVFSADPKVIRCVADAAQDRFPLLVASNIVQVVKLLQMHAPGVLVTDIAEDRGTIAAMTGTLKYHVPALVTVVVSARRDPAEMAWLINHGHIFRFLRKPLSIGRCAVCLHAALQHHDALKTTASSKTTDDSRIDDPGAISGIFERLKAVTERLA